MVRAGSTAMSSWIRPSQLRTRGGHNLSEIQLTRLAAPAMPMGESHRPPGALIVKLILNSYQSGPRLWRLSWGFTSGRVGVISGTAPSGVPSMFSLRIVSWDRTSSIVCRTASCNSDDVARRAPRSRLAGRRCAVPRPSRCASRTRCGSAPARMARAARRRPHRRTPTTPGHGDRSQGRRHSRDQDPCCPAWRASENPRPCSVPRSAASVETRICLARASLVASLPTYCLA
jgi:hypothetical protein